MASKVWVKIHPITPDSEKPLRTNHDTDWPNAGDDSSLNLLLDDLASSRRMSIPRTRNCFAPPIDVVESEKDYIIRMEIPGVSPDHFKVEWNGYSVIIHGERKSAEHPRHTHYHQLEIHYGHFRRVVHLPRHIDRDNTQATYESGFLEIHIPKLSKTHNIPITQE